MPERSMLLPVLMMLVLGPVVGSFLGVLIRRLPAGRPVALARSCCDRCDAVLGARDLVPLVSFVALGGRCRHCGGRIGWMHPAIELAGLAVAVAAIWVDGADPPRLVAGCVLGWTLLALAWIDAETMLLPDILTLPLVLLGLGATAMLDAEMLALHAAAAMLGYAMFAGVAAAFRRWRGYEGLGMGDAKLMAAAGAWLGLPGLVTVMLGGALLGLAWAGVLAGAQRAGGRTYDHTAALPFGPWLALAIWFAWLWPGGGG